MPDLQLLRVLGAVGRVHHLCGDLLVGAKHAGEHDGARTCGLADGDVGRVLLILAGVVAAVRLLALASVRVGRPARVAYRIRVAILMCLIVSGSRAVAVVMCFDLGSHLPCLGLDSHRDRLVGRLCGIGYRLERIEIRIGWQVGRCALAY
jgi:hypothetical protein